MTGTAESIARLAAAFEGGDGTSVRFLGARCDAAGLADILYTEVHCRLPRSLAARDRRGSHFTDPRDYVRLLSAANSGTGSWQPGWIVRDVDSARVVTERFGVRFHVPHALVRTGGNAPAAGDSVAVRIPPEYRELMPGFYLATGDADDDLDGGAVVRVYWNVSARGAVALLRDSTAALNTRGIPFHLKTHADPRNFGRTDSAVVYLRRERYGAAAAALAPIAAAFRGELRKECSAFAKEIAPGVAVAEDPGPASSFGQHRSRLLAEILCSEASRRAASPVARAGVIGEALRARGYDPGALFLNPGSSDIYPPLGAGALHDG